MVSRTLALAFALTSIATAAPTLKARGTDCQDTYNACVAAGTPDVVCSCNLTTCLGEDDQRERSYCSSATASLSSASASSYACNPAHSYPGGVTCTSTNGGLTLVTPTVSATLQGAGYTGVCNPAHSYPGGVTCASTNGGLTLIAPEPTTTSAAGYTGVCNPAHSYPGGVTCTSTNGGLTLITPEPTTTSAAGYTGVCNPAHSYPGGVTCTSTNGELTLITPKATATSVLSSGAASALPSGVPAGSNPTKVDGQTWNVANLTRYCLSDNSGCDYNFVLQAEGQTEACTIVRMPGSNAATESWSNENCTSGSDIKVSWGYAENPAPAFAVMTVVDGKDLAWFGVSDVNGQAVTAHSPYGSGQYGNISAQVWSYN